MAAASYLQCGGAREQPPSGESARAHAVPVREQGHVLADVVLVGRMVLVIDHPALRAAVAVAEILEQALAGLVANGTVERMVEEQRFERALLGRLGPGAVGDDDG